jgi:hypothetical protein
MTNPMLEDLRRMAEELNVRVHLAGMEARDRWNLLQPRLAEIERAVVRGSDRAEEVVAKELADLGAALRRLRDDIVTSPKP